MRKTIITLLAVLFFAIPNAFAENIKILTVGASMTCSGETYARRLARIYPTVIVAKKGHTTRWMYQQIKNKDLRGFTHLMILGGVNDINNGAKDTRRNLLAIYRKAKRAGLRVIAITISPWEGWPSWTLKKHRLTLEVNEWIRAQEGRSVDQVIDLYRLVSDKSGRKLAPRYGRNTDHLHPNRRAHILLAREAQKAL